MWLLENWKLQNWLMLVAYIIFQLDSPGLEAASDVGLSFKNFF